MPDKKKKLTPEEEAKQKAQAEKMHAKAQKAKAKRAKEREKEAAKRAKEAAAYEKAKAAERERAAKEKAEAEARANDPKWQAQQAKEAEKLKEKGRKELEKTRKKSAKKAAAAAKSKAKVQAKSAKASTGLAAAKASATGPKRKRGNVIALAIICVVTVLAVFYFWPPQDTVTMGLDIQGGVSVNATATTVDGDSPTQDQMEEAVSVITNRVNASGASAATVQQQGTDSFLIQVPGADDSQAILDTLSSQGVLEFVRVDAIDDEDVQGYIESGITGMNLQDEGIEYEAFMTGDNVSSVSVSREETSTSYAVDLELDSEGTAAFSEVTTELVSDNGQIAILLDGVVQSAPSVQSAITTGQVQITGSYTIDEANNLKAIINSGSLPVTLTIDQSSVVGPTLGKTALKSGVFAAMIGLLLVLIWLLLFYNGLGLIAGIAIGVMGCIYLGLLALLSTFGWFSLTLAGVAGIIVNLGLAADSSILMMECFHERLRKGMSIRSAAKQGVKEGILTSLDADAVTLVTAIILYVCAMGDVRGFGLTLALGIICDLVVMAMFSAPLIRICSTKLLPRLPEFFGIGDDVREGKFVNEEVM